MRLSSCIAELLLVAIWLFSSCSLVISLRSFLRSLESLWYLQRLEEELGRLGLVVRAVQPRQHRQLLVGLEQRQVLLLLAFSVALCAVSTFSRACAFVLSVVALVTQLGPLARLLRLAAGALGQLRREREQLLVDLGAQRRRVGQVAVDALRQLAQHRVQPLRVLVLQRDLPLQRVVAVL